MNLPFYAFFAVLALVVNPIPSQTDSLFNSSFIISFLQPQESSSQEEVDGDANSVQKSAKMPKENERRYLETTKQIELAVKRGELTEAEAKKQLAIIKEQILEDKEGKQGENWIERNLVLFISLCQLAWIIPTISICAIVYLVIKKREEQRTASLKTMVDDLGLVFKPEKNTQYLESLPALPLLQIGRSKQLKNLLIADTDDLHLSMFDYRFTVGHGKHQTTRKLSVGCVRGQDLAMPEYHLRPEKKFWDPLGSMLGMQDIDFETHQAFSDAFVLKSKTEKEVREFFDQQLLDEFATSPDLCIESSTNTFIYFRHWKRVEADATAIQDFLSVGLQRVGEIRSRLNR
jgi:hypothetical protein